MKTSELLAQRLKSELGFELTSLERVQRGKSGKAAGTWAWSAGTKEGLELGSEDTMTQCVTAKKLHLRQPQWESRRVYHVDAEPTNHKAPATRNVPPDSPTEHKRK